MATNEKNPSNSQGSNNAKNYTPLAPEGYTYLTVGELADRIRVSKNSIVRRCRDGSFPGAIISTRSWADILSQATVTRTVCGSILICTAQQSQKWAANPKEEQQWQTPLVIFAIHW